MLVDAQAPCIGPSYRCKLRYLVTDPLISLSSSWRLLRHTNRVATVILGLQGHQLCLCQKHFASVFHSKTLTAKTQLLRPSRVLYVLIKPKYLSAQGACVSTAALHFSLTWTETHASKKSVVWSQPIIIYQKAVRRLPGSQLLPVVGCVARSQAQVVSSSFIFKAPLVMVRENSLRVGLAPAAAHIWGTAAQQWFCVPAQVTDQSCSLCATCGFWTPSGLCLIEP